jgi:hypothetical protein
MQAAKFSINVKCSPAIYSPPSFLWEKRIWREYILIQQPSDPGPALELGLFDQVDISLVTLPRSAAHIISEHDSSLFLYSGDAQRLLTTHQTLKAPSSALQSLFMYAISHSLATQGGLALHGAAFQYPDFTPLILGDSRSGKSTLTSLALRMGAKVVSDDHLLLSKWETDGGSVFELESMRPDLHLRSPTHRLLREPLASRLRPASFGGEQRWILPHDLNPQFQRRANPTVILCSTVDRNLEETDIQPMPSPAALAELMRCSSPLFLSAKFPKERTILMDLMSAMIASLPVFRLRLGRDLFDKPEQTFRRLAATVS